MSLSPGFIGRSAALLLALFVALGSSADAQQRRFGDRTSGNGNGNGNDRSDRRSQGNDPRASSGGNQSSRPVSTKGMEAYRTITRRNIFDPDRRPMLEESSGGERREVAPPVRSGYIILTGTMVAEGRQLAFFNGSQSDFNRVISVNDQVAGCTVTSISSAAVDLKRGETALVLPVGKQLTLDDAPKVTTPEIQSAPPDASPGPSGPPGPNFSQSPGRPPGAPMGPAGPGGPPSTTAPASTGAPVDRAEMMRIMMERRQKETSK